MRNCPVCEYLHPLDVEYCTKTGKNIAEVLAEELQEKTERERQKTKQEAYKKLRSEIQEGIVKKHKFLFLFIALFLTVTCMIVGISLLNVGVGGILGFFAAIFICGIIRYFAAEKPAKKEADKRILILYPEQNPEQT
jgi:Flp pilus assembly protein TadB